MPLYKPQIPVAKELIKALTTDNKYRQNNVYLSGEMGVGKTYIASYVASKLLPTENCIIVSPPQIVTKWQKVIHEYAPKAHITMFKNHSDLVDKGINRNKNNINIINNKYFNQIFRRTKKDADGSIKNGELRKINDSPLKLKEYHQYLDLKFNGVDDNFLNKENSNPNKDNYPINQDDFNEFQYLVQNHIDDKKPIQHIKTLFIYDEVHQLKNSKLDCFKNLVKYNKNMQGLFLTGTIFNKSIDDIGKLLEATHPRLYDMHQNQFGEDDFVDTSNYRNNIALFMHDIWQYISISLSMNQVKGYLNNTKNQVHQTILPIKNINIDNEEYAYYDMAYEQLKSIGTDNNKAKLLASNYLDYPSKNLTVITKHPRTKSKLRSISKNFVTTPLIDLELKDTKKYRRMMKYIKKFNGKENKRILVYATDYKLIKELVKSINNDGFKARTLPKSLKQYQYSTYINKQYAKGTNVFVVNPNDVNVGVDIHANILIWYQLLLKMDDIIQAQRRIYRANSKKTSKVIILAYKLTYQEELVKDISNASKYNAAAYGTKQDDALTKITGVLLKGFK